MYYLRQIFRRYVLDRNIETSKVAYDALVNESGMSRRDALKVMGLTGGAAMMMGAPTQVEASSTDKEVRIVVVGGGAGGIMATVRLSKAAPNAKITLIAPNEIHLYQPGQVFMAAGLYTESDIQAKNADFVPSSVNWVKDEVTAFDPDRNQVTTAKNGAIDYDYLVVATGLAYDYEAIEGMSEALVGQNGISSVYLNDPVAGTARGGVATAQWFKDMRKAAESASPEKPIKVICTQPDTPIKCGGAPQKILYLSDDNLRGNGPDGGADVSKNAQFSFCKKGKTLFGVPAYNKTLVEEITPMYGNITDKWNHVLRKIDAKNKVATFEHKYQTKGAYDEDLEEYDMIDHVEMIEMEYDFIHVVPPMKPVDAVAKSKLGWQKGTGKGWLECDKNTLQHRRYKNVFGIGDILGVPKGKTGGSARHHGPILIDNMISVIEGGEPTASFDGYTVCPLKTQYGEIMLAEFNYDGIAPSFPILDPSRPRWIWWAFDLYMLKTMYWQLMMRGLM
jgi:sulfide:quinone oxidoreductase